MATRAENDAAVQEALRQLEVAANNIALRLASAAEVRQVYLMQIKEMSAAVMEAYEGGLLSAKSAAELANEMRNTILDMSRANDMDLGRAYAESLKKTGLKLEDVIQHIMNNKEGFRERFAGKMFKDLTGAEQAEIYKQVIRSAGNDRSAVTKGIPRMRWAARGLWIATAGIAIYNIGTAQNPWWQTGREGANMAGGLAGSIAAGAAMGALGGMWAGPIGVGVGALVGGILGAVLADRVYVEVAGTNDARTRNFVARFTSVWTGTDEAGLADALIRECANRLDFVLLVLQSLENDYSSDSDDVALEYVKRLKIQPALAQSVKANRALRDYLASLLGAGWTSSEEKAAIIWLKAA